MALTGLLTIALLGVLAICGGLMLSGALDRSWLQVGVGALLLGYLSWLAWRAGRVVRRSLDPGRARELSGA